MLQFLDSFAFHKSQLNHYYSSHMDFKNLLSNAQFSACIHCAMSSSTGPSQLTIFCSISDLKGVDLFRLDEGAKEDESMVLVDMKGREVGKR